MTSATLDLRVSGYGLDSEEITKALSITPDCFGYENNIKLINGKLNKTYWQCGCYSEEGEDINASIITFLRRLKKECIVELSNKYESILYVTIYPEEIQSNISFSKEVLLEICAYNLELCIPIFHMGFLKSFL